MDLIKEIVDRTKLYVETRKSKLPQELFRTDRKSLSLANAIIEKSKEGNPVIAEVKPASPSLGKISEVDPARAATEMIKGGACAVSVLTEPYYFSGSLDNLQAVRRAVSMPILRKDFIVDTYQLYESKHFGADAVLLMVAVLGEKTKDFAGVAAKLGLEPLVEVHDEAELDLAVSSGARLIGINNRNLRDLKIDLATTERLAKKVPKGMLVVSESGIKTPADVKRMMRAGAHAVLVGSSIMQSSDIAAAVRALVIA